VAKDRPICPFAQDHENHTYTWGTGGGGGGETSGRGILLKPISRGGNMFDVYTIHG